MTLKERITELLGGDKKWNELKKMFNMDGGMPPVPPPGAAGGDTFVDATLEDGTVLKISPAIEQGAAVMVVSEQGDMPAPDGEHKLSDGRMITVGEGKIVAIAGAGSGELELAEQVATLASSLETMKSDYTKLSDQFTAQTKELTDLKKEFDAIKKTTGEQFKAYNTAIDEIVKSVEPEGKQVGKTTLMATDMKTGADEVIAKLRLKKEDSNK